MRFRTYLQIRRLRKTLKTSVYLIDRLDAIKALGKLGDARDAKALFACLKDGDFRLRVEAVKAIGQIGDERHVEALCAYLDDDEGIVRIEVVKVLEMLGWQPSMEFLSAHLRDSAEEVRKAIIEKLEKLGWQPKSIAEKCFYYLHNRQISECVKIGPNVCKPLDIVLKNWGLWGQQDAIHVLEKIADERAINSLVGCLHHGNPRIAQEAEEALIRIRDNRVIEPLIEILKKEYDENVCMRVSNVLCSMKDLLRFQPFVTMLFSGNSTNRVFAANILGKIGDKGAVDRLVDALNSASDNLRREAAKALGNLKDPRSVEPLLALLDKYDHHGLSGFKSEVVRAIRKIGFEYIPPHTKNKLTEALSSDNYDVREFAAEAIERMGIESESEEQVIYRSIINRDKITLNKYGNTALEFLKKALYNRTHPVDVILSGLRMIDDPLGEKELISVMKSDISICREARNILNAGKDKDEEHVLCPKCHFYLGIRKQLKDDGYAITAEMKRKMATQKISIMANWFYVCPKCRSEVLI